MRVLTWVAAGTALLVAVGGAVVLTLDTSPDPVPSLHGDFERRFQPRMESPLVEADRDRVAAIGSIKDLRAVDAPKR